MAYLNDRVLDLGLNVLTSEANRLDICSAEPSTYAQATDTLSLGNKTSVSVDAPSARTPSGRKVTIPAQTAGNVTDDGTATHYALVDTANSRLLAAGALTAGQVVTNGNTFSTAAFDIGIPGPA